MRHYKIKLPKELHGSFSNQPKVDFELSSRYHIINGKQYNNSEELHNLLIMPNFQGYLSQLITTAIIITVFDNDDILKDI